MTHSIEFLSTATRVQEIQDLAAKYARQQDNAGDLQRTLDLAHKNLTRELTDLSLTKKELEKLVGANIDKQLIAIGNGRFVLVEYVDGRHGGYTTVTVMQEMK